MLALKRCSLANILNRHHPPPPLQTQPVYFLLGLLRLLSLLLLPKAREENPASLRPSLKAFFSTFFSLCSFHHQPHPEWFRFRHFHPAYSSKPSRSSDAMAIRTSTSLSLALRDKDPAFCKHVSYQLSQCPPLLLHTTHDPVLHGLRPLSPTLVPERRDNEFVFG